MMKMKIETCEKDGCLVARVTGEIDHHSAAGIREEIDSALAVSRPKKLILDLGHTDFMDSSGLGLILGRMRRCEEEGIPFCLLNPTPPILKILKLAGVESRLEIQFLEEVK